MKAYTDYPLTELGDIPNKIAPIREVTPVSYDGDKYVTVEFDGKRYEFKCAYLYTKSGRHGTVPHFPVEQLKATKDSEVPGLIIKRIFNKL